MKDHSESLIAVGFDVSMVDSQTLTLEMLDSVSETRPIWVMQSNGHVGHANSAMLARAGVDNTTKDEGVHRDENGNITGEIRELALAMFLGVHVNLDAGGESAIWDGGHLARQAGCTMVTDSLFWLVKQYCGATLNETLKYYTSATFVASLMALAGTFLLSYIV